jgi:hypothetical protein
MAFSLTHRLSSFNQNCNVSTCWKSFGIKLNENCQAILKFLLADRRADETNGVISRTFRCERTKHCSHAANTDKCSPRDKCSFVYPFRADWSVGPFFSEGSLDFIVYAHCTTLETQLRLPVTVRFSVLGPPVPVMFTVQSLF